MGTFGLFFLLFSVWLQGETFAADSYIVKLATEKLPHSLSRKYELEPLFLGAQDPRLSTYYLLRARSVKSILAFEKKLDEDEDLALWMPNYPLHAHSVLPVKSVFTDFYPLQWGLHNEGQSIIDRPRIDKPQRIAGRVGADINYPYIHKHLLPNLQKSVLIAVIDSGVDTTHPDLQGKIYRNEKECGKAPRRPTAEDPFPNDCEGYNISAPLFRNQSVVTDFDGHGTHIAGIIAAADDADGVRGVLPQAKILPVKVYLSPKEQAALGENPEARVQSLSSLVARGLYYAIYKGADVINLSLGWPPLLDLPVIEDLLEIAAERGIFVVASAGNDGSFSQVKPCAYSHVICVGAMGIDGQMTGWSNYGAHVDFIAPGASILSTFPANKNLRFVVGGYEYMDGSSQAAPFIAALLGVLRGLYPNHNSAALYQRLLRSTVPGYPWSQSSLPQPQHFLREEGELAERIWYDFKNSSQVSVDERGQAKLSFSFQLLGAGISEEKIEWEFRFSNSGLGLQDYQCKIEKDLGQCKLNIHARRAANKFSLDVVAKWRGQSHPLRAFFHLGKSFVAEFEYSIQEQRQHWQALGRLRAVRNLMGGTARPIFYRWMQASGQLALQFFVFKAERWEEKFFLALPKGEVPQVLYTGDFDLNGEADLLLVLQSEQGQSVSYRYLDFDGRDLFTQQSFRLEPGNLGLHNAHLDSLAWTYGDEIAGKKIALPVFWQNRSMMRDKSLASWYGALSLNPLAIYQLKLRDCAGSWCLGAEIIDNQAFYAQWGEQYLLRSEDLWPGQILSQSLWQRERGQWSLLMHSGQGVFSRHHRLAFDPHSELVEEKIWKGESLLGVQRVAVQDATSGEWTGEELFFSPHDSRVALYLWSSGNEPVQTSYLDNSLEAPFFHVQAVVRFAPQVYRVLLQSREHWQWVDLITGKTIAKQAMLKNSLLPQLLLRQRLQSFSHRGKLFVFVDETEIEAGQLHLLAMTSDDILAPSEWKYFKPPGCLSLDPSVLPDSDAIMIGFWCAAEELGDGSQKKPPRLLLKRIPFADNGNSPGAK